MSLRWVESHAPILDRSLLVETLEAMGVACAVEDRRVVVEAAVVGMGVRPIFVQRSGAWVLRHTNAPAHVSWARRFSSELTRVEHRRQAQLEAERRRQEELRQQEERRRLAERRRASIVERAEKLGYTVTERREEQQVRLVLVRRTY